MNKINTFNTITKTYNAIKNKNTIRSKLADEIGDAVLGAGMAAGSANLFTACAASPYATAEAVSGAVIGGGGMATGIGILKNSMECIRQEVKFLKSVKARAKQINEIRKQTKIGQ